MRKKLLAGQYSDYNAAATRSQFASILAAALDSAALPTIRRSEAAAIVARMAAPELRQTFTLSAQTPSGGIPSP